MARIIRLDTTISDTTAPRLAHSAGASGALSRYIAAYANASIGGTVTTLADNAGTHPLSTVKTPSTEIRLREDAARGFKYLEMDETGAVGGTASLSSLGTPAGTSFTIAAVVKDVGAQSPSLGAGGLFFQRAGNGQWQFRNSVGGAGNNLIGGTATGEWSLLIGTSNGASSTVDINGVLISGALTAPGGPTFVGSQHSATTNGIHFAEMILWPRALSANERTSVRAALKSRYSFLP